MTTAFTAGSLAAGQLANSLGTIYTVPAVTVAYLKTIALFNTNAATQTVFVQIKRNGGTTRVYRHFSLAQNESADVISPGASLQLSAGDIVQAYTTTAAAVDFTITGVLEA